MSDPVASPLSIDHITLDTLAPYRVWVLPASREHLVYALVGRMRVYANDQWLGTIGGRRSVTEPLAHVIRFPAGVEWGVTLILEGSGADCLLVGTDALENRVSKLSFLHMNDSFTHIVGTGTHERTVTEVPTPPGFMISAGETLNITGGVSSWPPHATQADIDAYRDGITTWFESMYFVCPTPAKAALYGYYPGQKIVNETVVINSGDILPMPLGSHTITSGVDSWCWYAWFYSGSALKKSYNKFSTNVGVYLS